MNDDLDIENIIISSRLRTIGTPSNFTYKFSQPITGVMNIVPIASQITHSQFTINKYNNKLYFRHTDDVYHTATITQRFYTTNELMNECMEQMNALVGVTDIYTADVPDITKCQYWIEQDAGTKLITIRAGDLLEGDFSLCMGVDLTFGGSKRYYNIGYTLGFDGKPIDITTYTAIMMPSLTTIVYEIRVNGLIKNKTHSAQGSYPTIMRLDQITTDGSLNYHQTTLPRKYKPTSSTIHEIEVQVFNDLNREAQLLHDWSMELAILRKL